MRVCIYGAGAGGGHFAARLGRSGHDVSVVARGPHLDAIQKYGLKLISGDEEIVSRPLATGDPSELGIQDLVIVTVKATALQGVANGLKSLVGPETRVLLRQYASSPPSDLEEASLQHQRLTHYFRHREPFVGRPT